MKRVKDYVINFSGDYDFCIFLNDDSFDAGIPIFVGNKSDFLKYPDLFDLVVVDHSVFFDLFAFIVEPE